MAKIIMICGKLCCGKSTYAKQLCSLNPAIILSIDEIMLALFNQHLGDKHEIYVKKGKAYLFSKSVEIVKTGIDVILDWGFWTKQERNQAREFYLSKYIPCELHYIDISDTVWQKRMLERNYFISAGKTHAYYVDDTLRKKVDSIFEPPDENEINIWNQNFPSANCCFRFIHT